MRTERWVTDRRTGLWVLGHCAVLRTTGRLVFDPSHGKFILKVSRKKDWTQEEALSAVNTEGSP